MVFDRLENLTAYTGLCKNLETLISYLEEHHLADLPAGKTVVDGEKVYIKIIEGPGKPSQYMDYEVHEKYVDVHVAGEGCELFEVALGDTTLVKPYTVEGDKELALVSGPVSGNGVLDPERFVLFLPGEAHKTRIKAAGGDELRHALIKVLYE